MKWWSLLQAQSLPKALLLQADHALLGPSTVKRFDGERFRLWQQAVLQHVERQHAESFARIRRSLLHILEDRSIDFVYVHIPIPHPPALLGVSGREDAESQEPGYASDLRTADALLGEIRSALVSGGRWDETALVLTSDHTVREFWNNSLFLSPSLHQAIAGLRERTVPFLVKLPRQTQALSYAEPFNAVVVHGVVQGLLREEFKKPEEVLDYIRRNAVGIEGCTIDGRR
jgi:arylsulfatase A-like enzyme